MSDESLSGKQILVTAGPTWVKLDAVRHIGNVSSGETGAAIARELSARGASVHLLLGPTRIQAPELPGGRVTSFVTFDDLHRLIREEVGSGRYDALVHAAAVSDYRPVEEVVGKIPSGEEELVIRLRRTPKIVDEVKTLDPGILLVKFKLECGRSEEELLRIARESGARSAADLVVANDLSQKQGGRHVAFLLSGGGPARRVETTSELAGALAEELTALLAGKDGEG